MARLLRRLAETRTNSSLLLKTLHSSASSALLSSSSSSSTTPAAFDENLVRILSSEIAYFSDHNPPYKPMSRFKLYTIQDRPGQQWIRLKSTSYNPGEEIKIDATMFDGAANPNLNPGLSLHKKVEAYERGPRLHISLVVEVLRAGSAFGFVCSAWPDLLAVENAFPLSLSHNGPTGMPYMGRNFKKIEEEAKVAVREYLENRGVDDDMANFLHDYMMNKDKIELIRWLKNIESYVKK